MVSFRFVKWCRTAVSRIVLPRDRITVEQELMGHLKDRYDYFREQGYQHSDAEMLSVDFMGNPQEIAKDLGLIHRPFWGRTEKAARIILIAVSILCLFLAGASFLKNFYFRPAFSSPIYETYNPYTAQTATFKTGEASRLSYIEPKVSFTSDGYKVTVSKAALWSNTKWISTSVSEESFPLYLQLTVTNPRIWAGTDNFSRWINAEDAAGNLYPASYESSPEAARIHVTSYRINPWTSVHELVIRDLQISDPQWVNLCYQRGNRHYTLRIDLTGGDAS